MGLGDTANILLKIKADGSQADAEFRKVIGSASGLGSEFATLAGPAGIATAAIAAVGVATVALGVELFDFTRSAAEFSSRLYDAHIQAGLSAESISALQLAAESSGGSLESAAGQVAKLNALVGAAAEGNKKAEDTLKRYGITARDTNEAFQQAVQVIGDMTDADQKAAAAKDLFKDKTGQILPLIDQVNGNFKEYIETAKKLGVVLSEEDLRAADSFGDSLEVLGAQAKIAGVKFATELMPLVTQAMNAISSSFADNQSVAQVWGRSLADTLRGVGVAFSTLVTDIDNDAEHFANFYGRTLRGGQSWSEKMIQYAQHVGFWFGAVGAMLENLGAENRLAPGQAVSTPDQMGPFLPKKGVTLPKIGGGGGGGKGGGGGGAGKDDAKREAEADARAHLQVLEKELRDAEELYKRQMATLDKLFEATGDKQAYQLGGQRASQAFLDSAAVSLAELKRVEAEKAKLGKETTYQAKLREQEAVDRNKKVANAISDEQEKVIKKTGESDQKLAAARQKVWDDLKAAIISTDEEIHAQLIKNNDADLAQATELFQKQMDSGLLNKKQRLQALDELTKAQAHYYGVATYEQNVWFERSVDQLMEWAEAQEKEINANIKDEDERKAALQAVNDELERRLQLLVDIDEQNRKSTTQKTATPAFVDTFNPNDAFGEFTKAAKDHLSGDKLTAAVAGIQMMESAFSQLGQAVGEAVKGFALFGTAGVGIKQFTATMIAELAKMAAVQAIWEFAQGLAMLALNFFWPDPRAAASATLHFHSAAVYGGLAALAAGVGRGVAGNSFNQAAGGGAGGAGSNQTQNSDYLTAPPIIRGQGQGAQSGTSGRRDTDERLIAQLERLEAYPMDHVFVQGLQRNQPLVGQALVQEVRRNPDVARGILPGMR